MDNDKCNALIPQWDHKFEGQMGECLLLSCHRGYHLNKLDNGKYISWGGNGCDETCEWCGECFIWIEITEEQAKAIIADPSKNNHD